MWEATGVGSRELMDFVKEEEGRIKKKSYWQMRCITDPHFGLYILQGPASHPEVHSHNF